MSSVDWISLFRDAPPRKEFDFRRKEEDFRYPFKLELGLNRGRGVSLPTGFLAGQKVQLLLREHTLHVAGVEDFDELPIPFRAVAADIVTGESYVLGKGDLARAIRASMSIPIAFAPVEIDGRLLVDGGIADNMPVDLARSLGADVIIAVDVSEPLREREEVKNFLAISGQMIGMLTRLNVEDQIPRVDVLLVPEREGYSGGDYDRAPIIVESGVAIARKHADELRRYAVSEEEYAAYREEYRYLPVAPERVDFIEVVGNERVDERAIRDRIRIRPGDRLDPAALEQDLASVYATDNFETIDWSLVERDGERGIVIRLTEKSWGPNYLRFGSQLDTDGSFTGVVSWLSTLRNARAGEWRNDLRFGSTVAIESEFYQPIDFSGHTFVAPSVESGSVEQQVFDDDGDHIADYDIDRLIFRLDAGVTLGSAGEARMGLVVGRATAKVETGDVDLLPEFDVDVGGARARIAVDRLDNPYFPSRGQRGSLDLFISRKGLGASEAYEKISGSFTHVWSRDRHHWSAAVLGGGSLGSELPAYDEFLLGGLFTLSGFEDGQLRGRYVGRGRFLYYYRWAELPSLVGSGIYVGFSAEAGNVWDHSDDILEDLIWTGAVVAGADTFLGPFYLGYGIADTGQDELYISLGRTP